jgi:hypothetical protein
MKIRCSGADIAKAKFEEKNIFAAAPFSLNIKSAAKDIRAYQGGPHSRVCNTTHVAHALHLDQQF